MKPPSLFPRSILFASLPCAAVLFLAACRPAPESGQGLRLPLGDIEKGKAAFVRLECHHCHRVSGVELPPPPEASRIDIPLGGEVYRVKTYSELVTEVINPRHAVSSRWEFMKDGDGNSIMPEYGDRMTTREVIDIVEFLQSRYKVAHPEYAEDL